MASTTPATRTPAAPLAPQARSISPETRTLWIVRDNGDVESVDAWPGSRPYEWYLPAESEYAELGSQLFETEGAATVSAARRLIQRLRHCVRKLRTLGFHAYAQVDGIDASEPRYGSQQDQKRAAQGITD